MQAIINTLKQIIIGSFFIVLVASSFAGRQDEGTFLVLSDFHYDASERPDFGYNDSNEIIFSSLKKTISSLAASGKLNPDFIIIPGDFLSHKFAKNYKNRQSAIQKTLKAPFAMLESAINNQNIGIFPVIGNNDSYCGDYCTSLKNLGKNGNFFFDTEKTWRPFVKKNNIETDFTKNFNRGGYYSATPIAKYPANKIIVINNVPFAPSRSVPKSDVSKAEYIAYIKDELTYLEEKLRKYRQEDDNVILSYHIPNLEICEWNDFAKEIKNKYGNSLSDIINKYNNTISVILAGHTHINFLALLKQRGIENTSIEVVGSIAKPFTPTFNVFHYNRANGKVYHHETEIYEYHAENNDWERADGLT